MVYGTIFMDLLALDEAQSHLETALAILQELGPGLLMLSAGGLLASALIFEREFTRARDLLDASLPAAFPAGQVVAPVRRVWSVRAGLELAQGNPDRALDIVDWLLASTKNLAENGADAVPVLSRLRGRALAALGRLEEAEAELHGTLLVAQQQRQKSMLWRLHADLGSVHRARGQRHLAEQQFSSARSIIEDVAKQVPEGALRDNFLQRALATIPPVPVATPRQGAKSQFGGLTAREREIAALIARGKSNREIAGGLVISESTAERHVANILSKLGFNSRTQIAVWAAEKGLR
jgi:DNA-binding CsgD family transcriptional regulator